MPTWKAYFQINGYDYAEYPVIDFPVPDDLYAEIQTALSENRPLLDCPFYEKLQDLAEDVLDLDKYRPDYSDLFPDLSGVVIASCVIDDPGDLPRLEKKLRGRSVSPPDAVYNEDNTRRYEIILSFDDDEKVESIRSVTAEGLVSESASGSSWKKCYPDYEYITKVLLRDYCHV